MALGLVLALALTLLVMPSKTTARLKLAIGGVFLPLFGLAGSSHQALQKAGAALTSRGELARQNELLRIENQRLLAQSQQLNSVLRENAMLRDQVKWQTLQQAWNLRLARVVTRDPANWWRTVQIDLGSRDGIRTNFAVLTTSGLVGRISSVSLTSSQVTLLGDPGCKVAAVVEETGSQGIIGANDSFNSSLVTLNCYTSRDTSLKAGQNVFTSGLGGVFPKGIFIGKIVDTRLVEYGLYTEARVKLAADLSALDEVWIWFP